ncbi:unnamed protein product [Rotaria socialis]|uniref:FLYWCH-type domain-containing protein n=1 Tax=Rotaria socialis TaxID=392032 RepID=A0A818ED15_9BILA|nr:unnamed protein product [Rotaria socialis]CAF3456923.1 unnamed protein product [Rotaria socialis]CAF3469908.1 unnamed protein product [Rotaria socialis]CAF4100240.1 unnamed protein product [Rotaria socialis]CAF4463573.1 unnamed protein product [Rotaria socialis]
MSNTPTITFSQSNKGQRALVCDGNVYHLNKSFSKVKYWRCENRLCAAVIHTDINDQFKVLKSDHSNRLSSPKHIEIIDFKSNIKQRVVTEATPIGRIYDEELAKAQLSQTALSIVASTQDAKSSLNRIRRLETPLLPKSCRFDIPTLYNHTINIERFLFYDKMTRNKRILIFATDDQPHVPFKAKHILMDGTFSSCPPFMKQVYTLHAIKFEQSDSIFKEMLQQLEEDVERPQMDFVPNQITTDFEKALVKTLREQFSGARHTGCFSRSCQAIYRKIRELGLSNTYKDDTNVRNFCRRLMVLPFLPPHEVEFAFEELTEQRPDVLAPLFVSFHNYWMKQKYL